MTCRKNIIYCLGSELDIFKGPSKQLGHEKNTYVPHYPLTTLSGGPVEFDVPASPMYTDLSETRLYLKLKVVNADGTDIASGADVAPVNMLFHALFSRVDVFVGNRQITQSSDTYPWKAAIETLLNFGTESKQSQLTAIGYHKDVIEVGRNVGHTKRVEIAKDSGVFELMGPLHVDLFFQEKYLLNGVNMRIKLTRGAPSFCLFSTEANANFKIEINQAILYIRRVKLSASIEIAHAKAIEKSNALYPVHSTETAIIPVGSGHRSLTKEGLFGGRIPRKLIVAMLSTEAYNGSYDASPFNFTHAKLNRIDLTLDGEPVADTPLNADFVRNNYLRAYLSIFTAADKSYSNHGLDISYADFKQYYPLFCFDLTTDSCGNSANHFETERQGNLRIALQFRDNLAATIYVVFYAEFENVVEITKSREVLI